MMDSHIHFSRRLDGLGNTYCTGLLSAVGLCPVAERHVGCRYIPVRMRSGLGDGWCRQHGQGQAAL